MAIEIVDRIEAYAQKYYRGMSREEFAVVCGVSKGNISAAVSQAVRLGVIVRQPCVVCGKRAHAHHHDYSKPLDVIWLCQLHHRQEHARQGFSHGNLGISEWLAKVLEIGCGTVPSEAPASNFQPTNHLVDAPRSEIVCAQPVLGLS